MLDLDSIIPGAFALLFDLSILSRQPPSLLHPSWLFTPFQTPLSHPIHHGATFSLRKLFSSLCPRSPCCTGLPAFPLHSLQHILLPASASDNCSLHFPSTVGLGSETSGVDRASRASKVSSLHAHPGADATQVLSVPQPSVVCVHLGTDKSLTWTDFCPSARNANHFAVCTCPFYPAPQHFPCYSVTVSSPVT